MTQLGIRLPNLAVKVTNCIFIWWSVVMDSEISVYAIITVFCIVFPNIEYAALEGVTDLLSTKVVANRLLTYQYFLQPGWLAIL